MTTRLRWWLGIGTMCSLGALHCGSDDPAAPPSSGGAGSGGTGAKAGAAGTAGSSQGTAGTGGSNGTAGTAGTNGTAGTSQGTAGTSQGTAGTAGTSQGTAGTSQGTAGTSQGTAGTSQGTAGTSQGTAGTSQGTAGNQGTAGTDQGAAGSAGNQGTAGTGQGSAGNQGTAGNAAAGQGGGAGSPTGTAGSGGGGGASPVYAPFPFVDPLFWVEAGRKTETAPGVQISKAFDLGYPADKPFGLFSTGGGGPTLDASDAARPFFDFNTNLGLKLAYGTSDTSVFDTLSGGYSLFFFVRSTTLTKYGPLFDCGVDQNKDTFGPLKDRIFFGRAEQAGELKFLVFDTGGNIVADHGVANGFATDAAFHLVGVTQNAQGAITLSVDGVAVGTPNKAGALPASLHRPFCYVGQSLYHTGFQGNQDFNGDLRGFFGFKRALDATETAQLKAYTVARWQ